MENPYKFDAKNHRVVSNVANNKTNVMLGTAAIYGFSMYKYHRRFYRIDGKGVKAAAFAYFSLLAAYSYSRFFFSDPINEAALINNSREGHE